MIGLLKIHFRIRAQSWHHFHDPIHSVQYMLSPEKALYKIQTRPTETVMDTY